MRMLCRWFVVLLCSTFAATGCASPGETAATGGAGGEGGGWGSGNASASTAAAASGSTTAGTGGSGGISGGGTGFTSPQQMFDWVNQTRQQYSSHIPYDGYPFQGQNSDMMTWTALLTWDDALAAEAQAEAEKIAAGTQAEGMYFPYQNEPGEGFWLTGLDTNRYKLSAMSDGYLMPGTDPFGGPKPPNKWHHVSNGFYRMAVAYQTGTGQFNHKSKLGIGAAEGGDQITWWVLLFSE